MYTQSHGVCSVPLGVMEAAGRGTLVHAALAGHTLSSPMAVFYLPNFFILCSALLLL